MLHRANVGQKGENSAFALYPRQELIQRLSGAGGWGTAVENKLAAGQLKLLNIRKTENRVRLKTQHLINTTQIKKYIHTSQGQAQWWRESTKSEAKLESSIWISSEKCLYFPPYRGNKTLRWTYSCNQISGLWWQWMPFIKACTEVITSSDTTAWIAAGQ